MKRNFLKKILAPWGVVLLSADLWAGDTAIVDGQNAGNVLGQLNFTGYAAAITQSRMYAPVVLPYDSGMNRLCVAENYNNRMFVHSVGPVVGPSSPTHTANTGVGAGAKCG